MYEPSLNVRTVQLPTFSSFEAVAASAHRAGFNATVVAVYRPGDVSQCDAVLLQRFAGATHDTVGTVDDRW